MRIEAIADRVYSGMLGRLAGAYRDLYLLLETIAEAGDGNYCEIGVLHGGSLCAAALLKKELGHSGICYGIDPFDGYYPGKKFHKVVDPISKIPVTVETVNENIKRFGLDNVQIVKALSHPFPIQERFAVTYIDGDHWGEAPWIDWVNVSKVTDRFVVFDDYDAHHPDVVRACDKAALSKGWELYWQSDITFILQKVSHA